MKFNYKRYWKDNIEWMTNSKYFHFSKRKAVVKQIYYTVRMFFRWNLIRKKKWRASIMLKKPEWIKE